MVSLSYPPAIYRIASAVCTKIIANGIYLSTYVYRETTPGAGAGAEGGVETPLTSKGLVTNMLVLRDVHPTGLHRTYPKFSTQA